MLPMNQLKEEFVVENSVLYPVRKLGTAAVILIFCTAFVYWELAIGVYQEKGFVWDEPIMLALHSLSGPWMDMIFYYITKTGDILIVLPVMAMFIYLLRRSERITAVLYVASVIVFPLISLWLKDLFGRPRQEIFIPLVSEDTYSFPSGHALTAVAVYGFAAVLLWQRGHRILAIISGFWVFVIGLSRVYLGAHYPSDVLASFALGTILLIIVLFIDKRLNTLANKKNQEA